MEGFVQNIICLNTKNENCQHNKKGEKSFLNS